MLCQGFLAKSKFVFVIHPLVVNRFAHSSSLVLPMCFADRVRQVVGGITQGVVYHEVLARSPQLHLACQCLALDQGELLFIRRDSLS